MERRFLVRYGVMCEVGRFAADADAVFDRLQVVVVRSHRGTELGEVLVEVNGADHPADVALPHSARILRAAESLDLERASRLEGERSVRFETCRRVLDGGAWPLELIDVESLLDDRRTILHYLGPHHLETAGLLAVFRKACDLDVMFQPAGLDVDGEEGPREDDANLHGCGQCGSEEGGCGSGGCGSGNSHSCGDCGVKKLIASRR